MGKEKKQLGAWGEEEAASYLQKNGLRIVERNYRCRMGEIDLIAREGDSWVFVEVKTRRTLKYGQPCEAVTGEKRAHILRAAQHYILTHRIAEQDLRFDVVEVLALTHGAWIRHTKNAF